MGQFPLLLHFLLLVCLHLLLLGIALDKLLRLFFTYRITSLLAHLRLPLGILYSAIILLYLYELLVSIVLVLGIKVLRALSKKITVQLLNQILVLLWILTASVYQGGSSAANTSLAHLLVSPGICRSSSILASGNTFCHGRSCGPSCSLKSNFKQHYKLHSVVWSARYQGLKLFRIRLLPSDIF